MREEVKKSAGVQELLEALYDAASVYGRTRWRLMVSLERLSPEAARFTVNKIDAALTAFDELEAKL